MLVFFVLILTGVLAICGKFISISIKSRPKRIRSLFFISTVHSTNKSNDKNARLLVKQVYSYNVPYIFLHDPILFSLVNLYLACD